MPWCLTVCGCGTGTLRDACAFRAGHERYLSSTYMHVQHQAAAEAPRGREAWRDGRCRLPSCRSLSQRRGERSPRPWMYEDACTSFIQPSRSCSACLSPASLSPAEEACCLQSTRSLSMPCRVALYTAQEKTKYQRPGWRPPGEAFELVIPQVWPWRQSYCSICKSWDRIIISGSQLPAYLASIARQ